MVWEEGVVEGVGMGVEEVGMGVGKEEEEEGERWGGWRRCGERRGRGRERGQGRGRRRGQYRGEGPSLGMAVVERQGREGREEGCLVWTRVDGRTRHGRCCVRGGGR